jgi:hypothetical protein
VSTRTLLVVIVALAAAGCSARRTSSTENAYVHVAEAISASQLNEAIRVTVPRLQGEEIRQACRNLRRVVRLSTPSVNMQMQLGERLALGGLSVVAVDDADVVVPGVPLAIEAEDQSPPVLLLTADDPDRARGLLFTINTGDFKLRTYTLCGMPGAEAVIDVKVVPVAPVAPPPTFPGQVTDAGRR